MKDLSLCRSWLFVPGDSERKIAKAPASGADVIIYDLEDSVAPANKASARTLVANILTKRSRETSVFCVRINPYDSKLTQDDVAVVMQGQPDCLMLPKLSSASEMDVLDQQLLELETQLGIVAGSTAVIALVSETPQMTLELPALAKLPLRVRALTWGAEDLATVLGASTNKQSDGRWRFTFELARSLCLLSARRNQLLALDTVYTDFGNDKGLVEYATRAQEDGFDGMLAIHPRQVAVINEAFSPSAADIERAEAILAAFAAQPDAGVVRLGHEMLDEPHRKQAERVLQRSRLAVG